MRPAAEFKPVEPYSYTVWELIKFIMKCMAAVAAVFMALTFLFIQTGIVI